MNINPISFKGTLCIHNYDESNHGEIIKLATTKEEDKIISSTVEYINPNFGVSKSIDKNKANLFVYLVQTILGRPLDYDKNQNKTMIVLRDNNSITYGNSSYIEDGATSKGVNFISYQA